jgi:competence protein ComFC
MNYESGIRVLSRIKKFIIDILFPVECLGCGKEEVWLCEKCLETIPLGFRIVEREYLDKILVCGSYDNELLKKAIHTFKYNYAVELGEPLGKILLKVLRKVSLPEEFFFVPVPLHKKRLKERSFNQAEILAGEVAKEFGVPTANVLCRVRYTTPQVELDGKDRQKNVQEAFCCLEQSKVKNRNIILIDDVLTTGATMGECAKILKESGANEVWGLVLAKG